MYIIGRETELPCQKGGERSFPQRAVEVLAKKRRLSGSQFINLLGTDHSIKIAHVQINIIRTSHVRYNHPQ